MKKLFLLCTSIIVVAALQAEDDGRSIAEKIKEAAERVRSTKYTPESRPVQTGSESGSSSTHSSEGALERGKEKAKEGWESAKEGVYKAWEKTKEWFSEKWGTGRPSTGRTGTESPTKPSQAPASTTSSKE
jgi:hypothetical protein